MAEVLQIKAQDQTPWERFDLLYTPVYNDGPANEKAIGRCD